MRNMNDIKIVMQRSLPLTLKEMFNKEENKRKNRPKRKCKTTYYKEVLQSWDWAKHKEDKLDYIWKYEDHEWYCWSMIHWGEPNSRRWNHIPVKPNEESGEMESYADWFTSPNDSTIYKISEEEAFIMML